MHRLLRISLLFIAALASSCGPQYAAAQDVSNLYLGGASYSAGASPAFAGSALYAKQVNASGTYAFTMIDALPATTKPFTVTTNVAIGIAQRVATIDGFSIFVPTAAGISYTGTNTGWACSTGVGVPFKFRTSKDGGAWYLMPTARVLKSSVNSGSGYQPVIGLLVGWGK